jgi:energy-coupling factor transport system permease protein
VEDFELQRYVTIGQYLPGDSGIHRLDPRTKITVFLFLTAVATFSRSISSHVILLSVALGLVFLAHLPLGYILSGLKPALPFIVALILLQLLFYSGAYVPYRIVSRTVVRWGWVHITTGSIQVVLVSTLRFLELMLLTSLLTNTTRSTVLTHGVESMLRPFGRLGFPAHELSLVATIALRFLPLLAEQLSLIMKAQASRGADVSRRRRLRFLATVRQTAVLIVPLFVDAFRRAEDLILAMEARCYTGGRGRSHYVRLRFARSDWTALLLGVIFAAGMLAGRSLFPV